MGEDSVELSTSAEGERTSEMLEISYQLFFFCIGTPLNIVALKRTSCKLREGGVESRLVKLSRQLMVAHVMVLFVYGFWRSFWLYSFWWTQGDLLCKVFSFLQALPFHLWSNIVAAIAVDMLCCIRSPLSSYRTGATRVHYFIMACWGAAIVCASPMVLFRGIVPLMGEPGNVHELGPNTSLDDPGVHFQCYPLINDYPSLLLWYNLFHVLTTFYFPLGIVIACYTVIGFSLHRQMNARRLICDGGTATNRSSATKVRFLRATIAIVCTFVFTWLPYQVLALLRVVCDEGSYCEKISSKIHFMQAIIIASTCINPFLYRFGTERRARGVHGSQFESTQTRAIIVPLPCKHTTTETIPFLSNRTTSLNDLRDL